MTTNPTTFNWTCGGSGGGSTANCSSPRVAACSTVQAICKAIAGGPHTSQPANSVATGCDVGVSFVDLADGPTLWNWQCTGSSAPYNVNCNAAKPCTADGASPGAANGSGPGNWVCCNADTDGNGQCGTQACIADGQCAPGAGAADGQPPHPQCGCQNPDTDGNGLCGAQPICTTWVWTGPAARRGTIDTTTSNTFSSAAHEYINNTQGCGAYATLGIGHYSCDWRGNMRLMLPSAVNNKYVTVKLNYTAQYGGYPPTYRELSFWKNTGNVTGGLRSGITGVLEGPKNDLDGPFILQSDRMYLPLHDNTPHLTRAELKVCEPFGACTADGQVAGPGGCCNGDANNDGICGCVPAADWQAPAVPCGCQNPDVDGNGLCGDQGGGGGGSCSYVNPNTGNTQTLGDDSGRYFASTCEDYKCCGGVLSVTSRSPWCSGVDEALMSGCF